MIWTPNWSDFDNNSGLAPSTRFEVLFCKEFFAIQQGVELHEIKIINGMKGIENIPINGVSFQSKYLKNWSWTQIKESLQNSIDEKRKGTPPYNELKKIIVYVKEVNYNYLKDPIIQDLKNEGIELEIFDGWEIIYTDTRYNGLIEYFNKNITNLTRREYLFDCGIDAYYINRNYMGDIKDEDYYRILKDHQIIVNQLSELLNKHVAIKEGFIVQIISFDINKLKFFIVAFFKFSYKNIEAIIIIKEEDIKTDIIDKKITQKNIICFDDISKISPYIKGTLGNNIIILTKTKIDNEDIVPFTIEKEYNNNRPIYE